MSIHLIENIKKINKNLEIDYNFYNEKYKNNKISTEKVFDKNQSIINSLREQIILTFQKNDSEEKQNIWYIVPNNRFIIKFITYKYEFKNNDEFKNLVILEIFRNLYLDPRDVFLYFGILLKKAKEIGNLNLKEILEEVLPLADENDWSGMGSMKNFLENIIKFNL